MRPLGQRMNRPTEGFLVYTREHEARRAAGLGERGAVAPGPPLTPPEPAPPGTRSQTLRHSGPRTQPPAGGVSPGPASAAGRGRALGGRGYRAGTAYLRLGRGSRRSHPRGGRPPGSRPHRRRHDPAAAQRPLVAGATGAGPGSLGWGSEHHAQRLPVRNRVPSWERAGTRWRWERETRVRPLRGALPGRPTAVP